MLVMQGFPVNVSLFQHSESDATLHISVDGATDFYMTTAQNGELCSLSNSFRGLKPPRFPSVFEALVNGIACQQLSLDFGITLLNRLAEAAGAFTTLKAGVLGVPASKGEQIVERDTELALSVPTEVLFD